MAQRQKNITTLKPIKNKILDLETKRHFNYLSITTKTVKDKIYNCWWCTLPIENDPIGCPLSMQLTLRKARKIVPKDPAGGERAGEHSSHPSGRSEQLGGERLGQGPASLPSSQGSKAPLTIIRDRSDNRRPAAEDPDPTGGTLAPPAPSLLAATLGLRSSPADKAGRVQGLTSFQAILGAEELPKLGDPRDRGSAQAEGPTTLRSKVDDEEEITYYTDGLFCCLNCIKAYIIESGEHDAKYKDSVRLLAMMACDNEQIQDPLTINPSPPWRFLQQYGGHLTVDQYREMIGRMVYKEKGIVQIQPITTLYEEDEKF